MLSVMSLMHSCQKPLTIRPWHIMFKYLANAMAVLKKAAHYAQHYAHY